MSCPNCYKSCIVARYTTALNANQLVQEAVHTCMTCPRASYDDSHVLDSRVGLRDHDTESDREWFAAKGFEDVSPKEHTSNIGAGATGRNEKWETKSQPTRVLEKEVQDRFSQKLDTRNRKPICRLPTAPRSHLAHAWD
eukprot:2187596-Amphidinium_carterae.1